MTVTARPRAEIFGDRLPVNNDGTPRPLLAPGRPYLTVHYTGSWSDFADFDDSAAEVAAIERFASSATKRTPWEYNWPVDTQGVVWTYSGEYQAAHSAGENSLAYGVILLLGVNQAPSTAMVDAFRRLRYELVRDGALAAGHLVLPHRAMPGAATTCPGDAVMARWPDFVAPWMPPIPIPNQPEEEEVAAVLVRADDGYIYVTDQKSYAHLVMEGDPSEAEWLRDEVGALVMPDGGPWPLSPAASSFVKRIAAGG